MKTLMEKKRWFAILGVWLLVMMGLMVAAPHAKEYTTPTKNAGLAEDAPSIQAEEAVKKYFPQAEGLPLFVVIHDKNGLQDETVEKALKELEGVLSSSSIDMSVMSLSALPKEARASFFAEDGTTLFVPVLLPNDLELKAMHAEMDQIKKLAKEKMPSELDVYWTGPAGIAVDTYEMFSRADVVLILATVGLIFVLLIVIYRSPLLAFIPLIGAGMAYMVVDNLIGLAGKLEWITIDSQALSIMTILLFAVLTDYSLLIFSRFREELREGSSINEAMTQAMRLVREPIFFSGSTVLLGVLTLFAAVYEPYRSFAPVFAIAVVVMLIAGFTLMPALFAIAGEKAFWPFDPRKQKKAQKEGFWHKVGRVVTKKPILVSAPIIIVLALLSFQIKNINYTFNLLDSFPDDMSSIQGYNQLVESFSAGKMAPSTLLVESKEDIQPEKLQDLMKELEKREGILAVNAQGNPFAEGNQSVVKLNMELKENPYSEKALNEIEDVREAAPDILKAAKIDNAELLIAGDSAKQADTRSTSAGDEIRVMSIMTVLIVVMLAIQTRSLLAPIYMMATILLSFGAALGFTNLFFVDWLGNQGLSYRTPLYTFVFLVALGVDYTIMLVSRIREEKQHLPLKEAVKEGVGKTGSVISSAGLILAATFAVLITQPVMELRVFGFAVAIGVLVDTFIVRPVVIPAIIVLLGKWSFWPKKIKE